MNFSWITVVFILITLRRFWLTELALLLFYVHCSFGDQMQGRKKTEHTEQNTQHGENYEKGCDDFHHVVTTFSIDFVK